jgi:multiple sugar transport system permease protein
MSENLSWLSAGDLGAPAQSSLRARARRVALTGAGRRRLAAAAMLSPLVLGLGLFAVYPAIYALALSFTKSTLGQPFRVWVGGANYAWQLSAESGFPATLTRSCAFSFAVAAMEVGLGIALAVLLNAARKQRRLIRTALLLPLMTPPVLVGVAWKLMLAPAGGLIDGKLMAWGVITAPISFLGDPTWAWASLMLADVWRWTPFVAILAFAALQQTPGEILEAARLDGASEAATLLRIELPLAAPALASIFLLRLIMAFKTFDLVYILTFGGPGDSTTLAGFAIWRTALRNFDVGSAATQTVLFALAVTLATLPVVWLHNRLEARGS